MITKKIKNFTLQITSKRFVAGTVPVIKTSLPKIKKMPQVVAQGQEQNIYSDVATANNDPVLLEISPNTDICHSFARKNIDATFISSGAKYDAKIKGRITAIQKTPCDNRPKNAYTMPYGHNALEDKKNAQALLLMLKKKNQRQKN